jgi:hypothetical protein
VFRDLATVLATRLGGVAIIRRGNALTYSAALADLARQLPKRCLKPRLRVRLNLTVSRLPRIFTEADGVVADFAARHGRSEAAVWRDLRAGTCSPPL